MYPVLRFNLRKQKLIGLIKAFIVLLSLFYALSSSAMIEFSFAPLFYIETPYSFAVNIPNYLLGSSVFISLTFGCFALIPKYLYANLISLINLTFGVMGIIQLIRTMNQPIVYMVSTFVLFGQIADMFDGRAADRWGSTPNGELFDDAADFTSFGLTTGALVFKVMTIDLKLPKVPSIVLVVIYSSAILFRLIRFVVKKRKLAAISGKK